MPVSFKLTAKQARAWEVLGSDARHNLLYGGSRSGKTFVILRAILVRALARKSRHAVLRFRFNHVKASIIYDTLPKVMNLCFPDVGQHCHLDKSDWFYALPNGSEIWFGGLDDKERTEKILGQEYVTMFLNECSQIPWASRNMAVTRLAQKVEGLRNKAYYDCNPPNQGHWTYRLFVEKRSPDTGQHIRDEENYHAFSINPADNSANLDEQYLKELAALPERMRQRFLLGQFGSAADSALWSLELLEQQRFDGSELPEMQRVIIAVDPSGCSGPEDERSDEIGIVVCGLGKDGKGYVLEDLSGKYGPGQWGALVGSAFDRHSADCVVAETNFGGSMVQEIIRSARPGTPFREVKASRGKIVRAEPVSALFEQQKVFLAGTFPQLEDQLCVVAGTLIETGRGQIPIEDVKAGDWVMTRRGLAPVKQSGQTGVSSSLMRLCTPEATLEVTPCHPIFCRGKFVSAKNVKPTDRLLVSRNWASAGHLSRGGGAGTTEWSAVTSGTQRASFFTGKFMSAISGQYRTDGIFTIATAILATIGRRIWNALAPPTITAATLHGAGSQIKTAMRGYQPQKLYGPDASPESLLALNVGQPGQPFSSDHNCTVQSSVSDARVIDACVPVYNLEVEPGYLPEYFANGILVHNCAMTTAGYTGDRSPDRADAMVWGLAHLFPALTRREDPIGMTRAPRVNLGYSSQKRR